MAIRTLKRVEKRGSWRFRSPSALARWGRRLARLLVPGDVIALVGPLGAGKTTLVQSIVPALGYGRGITSPTFALANEYATSQGAVYHLDLYRLSPAELSQFPLEEYWGNGLCLIEWADKARGRWPAHTLEIELVIRGPQEREIRLRRPSAMWRGRLKEFLPPRGGRRH